MLFAQLKKILQKFVPKQIFSWYHYFLAVLGPILYNFPAKKMIVIGVTGTKGKTSTVNFIWACLTAGGYKTGIISTVNIRIGTQEILNKWRRSMPGRFDLQKILNQMLRADCQYCVIETTSEGIKQYRHLGLCYDVAVLTNLSPEHLLAHDGSFEKYKKAKGKLFESLNQDRKTIKTKKIEKLIIVNKDSEHADYFLNFPADKKITFSIFQEADYMAENIEKTNLGFKFQVLGSVFKIEMPGRFNVYNALPGIIIGQWIGIPDFLINKGLKELKGIPGRLEEINDGQNFRVFVDYAHEKESLTNVLETAKEMKSPFSKIIILLGAMGGGRDMTKRPIMGESAAKMADEVIVSNEDPCNDDPKEILEDIARGAEKSGKIRQKNLFVIEDRRQGIRKALSLAKPDDIVLITGKGAEQSMIVKEKHIPWDDRLVVREELKNLMFKSNKNSKLKSQKIK